MTPEGKRRLGLVLLAGVALAAGAVLVPRWPHEQQVVVALERPADVREVEVTWTAAHDPDATGGWRTPFPSGAPAQVDRKLTLPNGDYAFDVRVSREAAGAWGRSSETFRVSLDGGSVTLFVRQPGSGSR